MGHTPFGYYIVGGVAVIDETAAATVRNLYKNYLSGLGLNAAAKEAGLDTYHGTAKRIMCNRNYLGDEFYPAIIDAEIFEQVQQELTKRAAKLGRLDLKPKEKIIKVPTRFSIDEIIEHLPDPILQAEYIYSLIRSEVY